MVRSWRIVLGVLGLAGLAGLLILLTQSRSDPAVDPHLVGIDVSHHQGAVDWSEIAGDKTTFAYIKATEGRAHIDPRFFENWQASRRAGIWRGAYHFFSPCAGGVTQAEHFLGVVGTFEGALVPVLDAEADTPCLGEVQRVEQIAHEVVAFLDHVEKETGTRPILYTTRRFYQAHLVDQTEPNRFWLNAIGDEPDYGPPWLIWQYTDKGRRRGIAGPVDLNIFNGSLEDLERLIVRTDQRE